MRQCSLERRLYRCIRRRRVVVPDSRGTCPRIKVGPTRLKKITVRFVRRIENLYFTRITNPVAKQAEK